MPRPAKRDLTTIDGTWTGRTAATHSLRSERARERARALRGDMSPPERLLWTRVRGSALGVRIRRQHPLGRFTVDFYCHAARLVIEIDGYCHTWSGAEDVARSDYLRANGLHVVRFEAREVMRDVASVVSAIRYELEKRLSKVGAQVEVVGLVAPSAAEDGGTSPLGGGAGAGHAAPR